MEENTSRNYRPRPPSDADKLAAFMAGQAKYVKAVCGVTEKTDHKAEAERLRASAAEQDALHAAQEAAATAKQVACAQFAELEADRILAQVTDSMLRDIGILLSGASSVPARAYGVHRKALAPLAAKYGYKLVLVGNKANAALTAI